MHTAVFFTAAGEPIDAFCARAAEGCGVVLLPATVYDHDAASAGQHFRLGLGRTNLKGALQKLEQWLQTQQCPLVDELHGVARSAHI
jgi:hypothetical protein